MKPQGIILSDGTRLSYVKTLQTALSLAEWKLKNYPSETEKHLLSIRYIREEIENAKNT